jgi:hypothetical protein
MLNIKSIFKVYIVQVHNDCYKSKPQTNALLQETTLQKHLFTGMSNTNCCAGRIISLNAEKIVKEPQIKKYPMFLSVLKAFLYADLVFFEGFKYFDLLKPKNAY